MKRRINHTPFPQRNTFSLTATHKTLCHHIGPLSPPHHSPWMVNVVTLSAMEQPPLCMRQAVWGHSVANMNVSADSSTAGAAAALRKGRERNVREGERGEKSEGYESDVPKLL